MTDEEPQEKNVFLTPEELLKKMGVAIRKILVSEFPELYAADNLGFEPFAYTERS